MAPKSEKLMTVSWFLTACAALRCVSESNAQFADENMPLLDLVGVSLSLCELVISCDMLVQGVTWQSSSNWQYQDDQATYVALLLEQCFVSTGSPPRRTTLQWVYCLMCNIFCAYWGLKPLRWFSKLCVSVVLMVSGRFCTIFFFFWPDHARVTAVHLWMVQAQSEAHSCGWPYTRQCCRGEKILRQWDWVIVVESFDILRKTWLFWWADDVLSCRCVWLGGH